MNQKEKKYLDPESNNNTTSKLINSSLIFNYYDEELKAIQRSIALLRQDLHKIIHDELAKHFNGVNFNKNEY